MFFGTNFPRKIAHLYNRVSLSTQSTWILVAIFLLLMLFYGRIVIESDGISNYGLTVSLLQDHDFDLSNQYVQMREVRVYQHPVTQKIASMYSCGFAVLYAPFLWVTEQFGSVFPSFERARPYAQNARFRFPDALGIFVASSIYGFLAVLLAVLVLVHRYKISPGIAAFLSLTVFAGTPMAFYTFCSPSFIHAADSFLIAAGFFLATAQGFSSPGKIRTRNLLLGFVLALSILLRNNNIVLIPVIMLAVLFFERAGGWKRVLLTCVEIFVGALPVLAFHAWYNWNQYGSFFATGYPIDFSQQALPEKWESLKKFHAILLNPSAGIFVWAPVTFLSFVGLILGVVRKRRETILGLLCVLVVILSIRFAGFAWTGASFGQRYVIHLFIFFVVGLGELSLISKRGTIILSTACVFWGFILWNAYLINFASPVLRNALTIQRERQLTPLMLIRNTGDEYERLKTSGRVSNFAGFWWDSLGARPYPTILHLLMNYAASKKVMQSA